MSLATWKREFYKTSADQVSRKFALKHSLRKWTGLLSKNRRKHKLELRFGTLTDDDDNALEIDRNSCSLCLCYDGCLDCPLKSCHNQFCSLLDSNLAFPMINLLKKALINDSPGNKPENS